MQSENSNIENNVININKSVQIDDKRIETILDGNNDSFINELADLLNNVVDDKLDSKKGSLNGIKILKPFINLNDFNKNQILGLSSKNEEGNINLDLNQKLKISDKEILFPGVDTISNENKANNIISYNSGAVENFGNIRTTTVKMGSMFNSEIKLNPISKIETNTFEFLKEKIKHETNRNLKESNNHGFFFNIENTDILKLNNFQESSKNISKIQKEISIQIT